MEKVYEMMDELMKAMKELFPDMTRASIQLDADGYESIGVIKWGDTSDRSVEQTPRKNLFIQSRICGEWGHDESEKQNQYLKECGCLLEEV